MIARPAWAILLLSCLLVAGCDNVVARGGGGSESGVEDAEIGVTF